MNATCEFQPGHRCRCRPGCGALQQSVEVELELAVTGTDACMQQPDSRGLWWWCVMKRDEWWSSEVEIDFLGRGVLDLRPGTAQAFPAFRCARPCASPPSPRRSPGPGGVVLMRGSFSKDCSDAACLVCPGRFGILCQPAWAASGLCRGTWKSLRISHRPQLNPSVESTGRGVQVGCGWSCKKAAFPGTFAFFQTKRWILKSAEEDTSVALRVGGRDC